MNYNRMIDQKTWHFIKKTDEYYKVNSETSSIANQRYVYDDMCRAFFSERPNNVRINNLFAEDIPLRHYSNAGSDAAVIYFHGGGFVFGGLESHDDICADICAKTGFDVFSVGYRLAPEHKYPAMFEDAIFAVRYLMALNSSKFLLCGDSSGGNLAASVVHTFCGKTKNIVGQVLIYPSLGGDPTSGSYLTHANAPMLTLAEVLFYRSVLLADKKSVSNPAHEPLMNNVFSEFPPTIVFTAQCDPLADDGYHYCAKIIAAGGKAELVNEKGLIHGYLRARRTVPRAKKSFNRIVLALLTLGQERWPYNG